MAIIVAAVWTIAWVGSFGIHPICIFPRLQGVLGLPLRWRGLVTTPFFPSFISIVTTRRYLSLVPQLNTALQDKDMRVCQAAIKALGEVGTYRRSLPAYCLAG